MCVRMYTHTHTHTHTHTRTHTRACTHTHMHTTHKTHTHVDGHTWGTLKFLEQSKQGRSQPRMKVLCRWGTGGMEPPKHFWREAFLMQEKNSFTSFTFQAASRWLTCSCWLTWHKTRTYLLKHREKEKQARKLRDRQEKESAKTQMLSDARANRFRG